MAVPLLPSPWNSSTTRPYRLRPAQPALLAVLFLLIPTVALAQPPLFPPRNRRTPVVQPKGKLDLIDRHAAAAPQELVRDLQRIDRLIAEQQWSTVVGQLQHLLDMPEDQLIREGSRWRSLKALAEDRVHQLLDEGRRAYLNRYEKVADAMLDAARAEHDFTALVNVATRFANTPAGESALDEASALLADAGDFVTAAAWMENLENAGAAVTATAEWKSRHAAVQRQLKGDDPADGLSNLLVDDADRNRPLVEVSRDWTMLYGGPARLATATGDRPLLLEEWSARSTQQPELAREVEHLVSNLVAKEHAPVPISHPVIVDGRVVVSTLRGIELRELETGRSRWRIDDTAATEVVMLAEPGAMFPAVQPPRQWDDPDTHPLSTQLFRDSVAGRMSSDGRQLFRIEDRAPLLGGSYDIYSAATSAGSAILKRDHSTNTLNAYDLSSGNRLWTIGGQSTGEPFSPPLTGVYFFGPPTPCASELFAIGADGGDINLYCLDAATGHPQWKQIIAQYDNTQIADDMVRQTWGCSPTVSGGFVYCPTNSGWLTAVDRLRRRIAWSARYADGEVNDRYQPQYSLISLDDRWSPGAPIVARGTVVFAPPELPDEPTATQPHLYRFDAVTGELKLAAEKQDGVAVAGVFGESILVVGRKQLTAWPLDRDKHEMPVSAFTDPLAASLLTPGGWLSIAPAWHLAMASTLLISEQAGEQPRWSVGWPDEMTPCGLGVAVDGIYWVPFYEGAIVGFRTSDGHVEATLRNDSLRGRLGNLAFAGDRVISTGPAGVVALWQAGEFERQTTARLADHPHDATARIRSARVAISAHRWDEALDHLKQIEDSAELEPELAESRSKLRWQCLTALFAGDATQPDERWRELESLAKSPEQQLLLKRLQIDRAIAGKRWSAAIDACWEMIDAPQTESDDLPVHQDAWLAGRLRKIFEESPDDVQAALTRNRVTVDAATTDQAERLERLFAFHPDGRRLTLRLAKIDLDSGRLGAAERRLAGLFSAPEHDIAASAAVQLASLWDKVGSAREVEEAVRQVESLPRATKMIDGPTAGEWLSAWKNLHRSGAPVAGWRWRVATGQVVRTGIEAVAAAPFPLSVHGRPSHWLGERRFDLEGTWDGLAFVHRMTGAREWSTPLPDAPGYEDEPIPTATAEGSLLAVCFRGLLHVYSPLEKRELWNWPLPPRFGEPSIEGWGDQNAALQPATSPTARVRAFTSALDRPREGLLLAFAGRTLLVMGHGELVAFDALNGQELWRQRGIDARALLMADSEVAGVSAMQATGAPAAFRVDDGSPVDAGQFAAVLKRAFAIEGDTLITMKPAFSLFTQMVVIAAERPVTGEVVWAQMMPAETVVHRLPSRELAGVQPDGKVFVIDLASGERRNLGRLATEDLRLQNSFNILADDERVYVAVHHERIVDLSYVSVRNFSLNGDLVAFDREHQKLLWREKVTGSSILVSDFEVSPVIIAIEFGTPERQRNNVDGLLLPELKIVAYEKQTGARVVDWSGIANHGGSPATLTIDPRNRRIDLNTYNDRYRLLFGSP